MEMLLRRSSKPSKTGLKVFVLKGGKVPTSFSPSAQKQVKSALQNDESLILFADAEHVSVAMRCEAKVSSAADRETLRVKGNQLFTYASGRKAEKIELINHSGNTEVALLIAEGFALSAYRFDELKSQAVSKKGRYTLSIIDTQLKKEEVEELAIRCEAVFFTRDLVNRPLSHLTAEDLAKTVAEDGKKHHYRVEVLTKRKIESLKMGGLLAVNKGSIDPPTFTIAEWKPKNAFNNQPIVLVGKGVVYDTGGMSLKPTPNSMDFMKSDMAGAAMMAGTMQAIARLSLPLHVIALLPATDNRPDGNAYVPGDVITMYDGTTVEVKNTDAEGRLLLADALAYAKKFDPLLVIDAATLTGASVRAIGTYASSVMGTANTRTMTDLEKAGEMSYERIVQFPLWKEYGDELNSDVADMSNLGKGEAGQISAGKFLEHFTDYPWIHIDIAGPSYLHGAQSYRLKGGTGVGVRLLLDFFQKHFKL